MKLRPAGTLRSATRQAATRQAATLRSAAGPLLLLALAAAGSGCSRASGGTAPGDRSDSVLVGIRIGADTATVFSEGAARLIRLAPSRDDGPPAAAGRPGRPEADSGLPGGEGRPPGGRGDRPPAEKVLARVGGFEPVYLGLAGGGVTAWGPWGELSRSPRRIRLVPEDPDDHVFIAGRPYRGEVEAVHLPDGTLTVANRVALEAYLVSVVSAELGDEGLSAPDAARAQAVAARSYAILFGLRRRIRDSLGVNLLADPAVDQSYPGVLVEREAGRRAVRRTRDLVLAWQGRLAEAYYHSTCGGRTARPAEVWPAANRPYLPSIRDAPGEEESDFCSISPLHRWSRAWTAAELDQIVRPALARATGRDPDSVGAVREITVTGRSEGGRVTELTVLTAAAEVPGEESAAGSAETAWMDAAEDRPADTLRLESRRIPAALPSPGGEPLPSTWFEIVEPPGDGGLALHGRGAGHGVGMCQWGAVARARAGAGWREILSTYYPGTEVERLADPGRRPDLDRREETP